MSDSPGVPDLSAANHKLHAEQSDPSAQEILIRLLEQLTIPPDLYEVVESLKLRIEAERSATGWKRLLNDVAHLGWSTSYEKKFQPASSNITMR